MRKRLIVTTANAAYFLALLFFSERYILPWSQNLPPVLLLGALLLLNLLAVIIWDVVGVFTLWRLHKAKTLIPVAICVTLFLLIYPVGELAFSLRIREFKAHLPEFEKRAEAGVLALQDQGADAAHELDFGTYAGFDVVGDVDGHGVPAVTFSRRVSELGRAGYRYRPYGNSGVTGRGAGWRERPITAKWSDFAERVDVFGGRLGRRTRP
jgi:hypothetical protein